MGKIQVKGTGAGRLSARQARAALLLAAVVLLAGAGLAFWLKRDTTPIRSEAASGVPPGSTPAAGASPPAQFASAPSAALAALPEFDAQALRQLDRQWCSHGAQALLQFSASVAAQFGDTPEADEQAKAQLRQWPSQRAMEQLQQQRPQQWIASLLQRGDVRSRATALFLASSEAGNAAAAVTELSALAHDSADPYVAALAQQRAPACRALAGCQPLSSAERLAKEPNNLVAFFDAYGDAPDVLRRLDATLPRANKVRLYNTELLQTLLSLPLSTEYGLYREVEQVMLMGLYAAWQTPNFSGALSTCRKLPANATTDLATCQTLAETLWTSGESVLERGLAVWLAKTLRLQEQQADWLRRQQQLERVRQESLAFFDSVLISESALANCEFQRRLSGHLHALSRQGEWQIYATRSDAKDLPSQP